MMGSNAAKSILVATIGAEPQVISLATQLLQQRRETVHMVEVVHTTPSLEPIRSALADLRAVFSNRPDWPPLQEKQIPVDDILDHEDLHRFQDSLFQSLKTWIRQEFRMRLLLAGGRKTATMMGMAVAQLLFRPCDQVLYLSSSEDLRLSRRHILKDHDRVQLHTIPLPPRTMPGEITHALNAATPDEAYRNLETDKRERIAKFMASLTRGEVSVAKAIASGTQSNAEVAGQLNLSPRTVSNRLTSIYSKLEIVLGRTMNKGIKREMLRTFLNS